MKQIQTISHSLYNVHIFRAQRATNMHQYSVGTLHISINLKIPLRPCFE